MKKHVSALITGALVLASLASVSAHPGRTDSNGGHTCRTNCDSWGLSYGEYHDHNGGGSSSGGSGGHTQTKPAPAAPAPKKPVAPTVVKKTIVAVDNANVFSYPSTDPSYVSGSLWYGAVVVDQGGYPDFYNTQYGYVPKTVLTSYTVSKPQVVTVQSDKGYFFNTAATGSKSRGYALKGTQVNVAGHAGNFFYGSSTDANGKVLVGFISKTVVR
ncbi:YHYH domain-containing protein [Brevibacillus dissolubilis]|uniref:YHYH domain-containing protein n=1 Tax=Brevibacillus dissolubilis TaxID=1844116 RepID=UPI001116FC43|nr:YHYH domain-containing protein [Brevibacillus dissolubilis]